MTSNSDYLEIWINDVDTLPRTIILSLSELGSTRSYHGSLYVEIDGKAVINNSNFGGKGGSGYFIDVPAYSDDSFQPNRVTNAKVNISTNNKIPVYKTKIL